MATKSTQEKKLQHLREEENEEEEEEIEALSLCDLPVIDQKNQSKAKPDSQKIETQEDFDFRIWGGPFSKETEMCVADEVFFQGQILPLHHSFKRCESMSESLDRVSLTEFRSNSSRSSSIRSQNSSTSNSSTTTTTTSRISKPRVQQKNHFHTHPSPQPQLKATIPRQTNFGNHTRKSSAWEFFRLGVVPAPEIALQDLKVRGTNSVNKNNINPNSSSSSSNGNVNANSSEKTSPSGKKNHVLKKIAGIGGGFWSSGCKCSVETVQSNNVIIKSGTKSANKTESTTHAAKEKVVERKKQKQREKQGKRTISSHRTFEWLKELSHANYPEDEALLSKS